MHMQNKYMRLNHSRVSEKAIRSVCHKQSNTTQSELAPSEHKEEIDIHQLPLLPLQYEHQHDSNHDKCFIQSAKHINLNLAHDDMGSFFLEFQEIKHHILLQSKRLSSFIAYEWISHSTTCSISHRSSQQLRQGQTEQGSSTQTE